MFHQLGVIADIHGNALALEAVLRDARRHAVARFVNLGDILHGPLLPLETFRILERLETVASIAGNQDRALVEPSPADAASRTFDFVREALGRAPVAWLGRLPKTAVVDGAIFLCHGTPDSDTTCLLEEVGTGRPEVRSEESLRELLGGVREPVILCAHSHVPRVVHLANGQLIVNPGSVGLPAYESDTPVRHRMETFSPHASYAILEQTEHGWNVSLHRVAYDWHAAAAQAREQQREDWAIAIATGRMVGLQS